MSDGRAVWTAGRARSWGRASVLASGIVVILVTLSMTASSISAEISGASVRSEEFGPDSPYSSGGNGSGSQSSGNSSATSPSSTDGISPLFYYCDPLDGECGGGSGGCNCSWVWITLHVFVANISGVPTSVSKLILENVEFTNGQQFAVASHYPYQFRATAVQSFDSGAGPATYPDVFGQWTSNAGNFTTSAYSNVTTFVPNTAGGDLNLITNFNINTTQGIEVPWGGLVESGTNITSVQGMFDLDSSAYVTGVTNACESTENTSVWVGIGGQSGPVGGNFGLWQVGVIYSQTSSGGSLHIYPFEEDVGFLAYSPPVVNTSLNMVGLEGHWIVLHAWLIWSKVGSHAGYDKGGFSVYDNTTHRMLWNSTQVFPTYTFHGVQVYATPDRTTGEWIVESEQSQGSGCQGNANYDVYQNLAPINGNFGLITWEQPKVTSSAGTSTSYYAPIFFSISQAVWTTSSCSDWYQTETPAWVSWPSGEMDSDYIATCGPW